MKSPFNKMVSSIDLQQHDRQLQEMDIMKLKRYELRDRVQKKSLVRLPGSYSNVETMCKLLCKPISINVTRLSVSELNEITKSKSYINQLQDSVIQTKKHEETVRTIGRCITKNIKSNEKRKSNSGKKVVAKKSGLKKMFIQDIVKGMKQPYIKLHRVDEVVNKTPQSFMKTIPNDKCEKCVEPEYIGESQVELSEAASEPLESSTLNVNKFNIKCIKDNPSQSVTANSHINQILESIKYTEDQRKPPVSSKVHIFYKRKQICDGNTATLQEAKRLKLYSSKGVRDIYISNEVQGIIQSKCIIERQTVPIESCEKLNPSALCYSGDKKNLNSQETADMLQENSSVFGDVFVESKNGDNVSTSIEKGSPTIYMVSESNSTCIKQDKTESKEIQNSMQQSIPLDKCIVEKYNILKELRVLLIRLDSFRKILDNNYSAIEIEQLTDAHMKYLMSSNLSNKGRPIILNYTGLKAQLSPNFAVSEDSTTPNYSCSLNNKIDSKGTHNTIKTSSNVLQNAPLRFIKQKKQQTRPDIKVLSTCHNFTGHFMGVSEKNSKQNAIRGLKQVSVVSPPIKQSTLQTITKQCPNKSLELLCTAKDTVGTKKLVDVSHTSSKNISLSKERTSKILLSKANSIEHLVSQVPEVLTSGECKLFGAQANERLVTSTENPQMIKFQISTKKNISTDDYFIISSQKHVKSIDTKNTKSTDYKCIVCEQYFKNYFNLQQHLRIHTQKHDNNSSDLSKSSLPFSEELQQTRSNLPASEISEFTESSDLKTAMFKGWMNDKDKNGKHIEGALDSNKCSIICSQMLSTSSDHIVAELLKVYKLGTQNLGELEEGKKNKRSPELRIKKTIDPNSIANNVTRVTKRSPKVVRNEKILFPQDVENGVVESTVLSKENSSSIGSISNINLRRQKMKKPRNVRKNFKVCDCHSRAPSTKSCFQIEIVLLCHICRVLFRTMECFETHYRFSKHVACNENRLNGRSPNLFCTSCGMIFSSVQDVRQHLEIHVRFNKNCTTEFRCNICKVIFIGIGSLFYIHWSKHIQDPFWIASERSFPKNSIIISKFNNTNNCDAETTARTSTIFVEKYLQVAEYVCQNCKLPFLAHNDLQQHVTSCDEQYLNKGTTISESNLNVQTNLPPLCVENQGNGFLPKQAQTTDSANKVVPTKCNSDKERLIRILEGCDDSGYELQIDLTKSFDECNELSEKEEIEQIQHAIQGLSDADTWIPTPVENLRCSENIMVNVSETNINASIQDVKLTEISQHITETVIIPTCPQNLATPTTAHDKPVDTQINAGVLQVSCLNIVKTEELEPSTVEQVENLQSNVVYDIALIKKEEESSTLVVPPKTPARQQSPQKPRVGYLRVKPLAELIDHTQRCENPSTSTESGDRPKVLAQNVSSEQLENGIPRTGNSKKASVNSKRRLILLSRTNKSSLSTSSTSTQHQRPVDQQIVEPDKAINSEKMQQSQPEINQNAQPDSQVQNVTQAPSTNSPSCNMVFQKDLPSTASTIQDNTDLKQYRSIVIRQPNIMQGSSVCYQFPYSVATDSNKVNQMPQQVEPNTVPENISASTYYKNTTFPSGGISMVINQTAPNVQNVPIVNVSQLPADQQIYQAPVYNAPLTTVNTIYPMQPQVYWMWPGT